MNISIFNISSSASVTPHANELGAVDKKAVTALDEINSGALKQDESQASEKALVANMKTAFESQSYSEAIALAMQLKARHPASGHLLETKALLLEIDKQVSETIEETQTEANEGFSLEEPDETQAVSNNVLKKETDDKPEKGVIKWRANGEAHEPFHDGYPQSSQTAKLDVKV